MANELGYFLSSVYKHFRDVLPDNLLYIEGESNLTTTNKTYELRTNGPHLKRISKTESKYILEVQLCVKVQSDPNRPFAIMDAVDIAQKACTDCIAIKKYPDSTDQLDVAQLSNSIVAATNMGPLDPVSKIMVYHIECEYTLEVTK